MLSTVVGKEKKIQKPTVGSFLSNYKTEKRSNLQSLVFDRISVRNLAIVCLAFDAFITIYIIFFNYFTVDCVVYLGRHSNS